MRHRRTTQERAESFMEMLTQNVLSRKAMIESAKAVAPCPHPISDSRCIGGPDDQNLWRCLVCGHEWLR